VGQVTPDMLESIGYGTYLIFGILTFMGAGFIWWFVPETKRLTLEEMVRNPISQLFASQCCGQVSKKLTIKS
jgi:hypothetical protein